MLLSKGVRTIGTFYVENGELKHYGVVGMRWGIRKAQMTEKSYRYKSRAQKKYDKKLRKQTEKGASSKRIAKTTKKLNQLKERDYNREEYARTTGIGRSIVKGIVFGPLGSGNYNRMRASGSGRIASALVANYVSSTLGYPLTLAITKSAENKAARNQANARRDG